MGGRRRSSSWYGSSDSDHASSPAQQLIRKETGAGISTSAGIPDFRSPETGLYANLARLDLPYAEAVFDISYFRSNPLPFYTLAQELYPGRFRPTLAHAFLRLLHDKGLLLKLFTQNIDCLEREAGVPDERIVEAHGSFARQRCIECRRPYPDDKMRAAVAGGDVPHCGHCLGLVKPDIVFFGEQLPAEFFASRHLPAQADLCIVMGTSLTVQPFASLPQFVPDGVPRVLINLERVGAIGSRPDDVLLLGDCDEGVRKLAEACGWLEELEEAWRRTAPEAETDKLADAGAESGAGSTREKSVEDEVEKLAREVDETLRLSESHRSAVSEQLGKETEVDGKEKGGGRRGGEPSAQHSTERFEREVGEKVSVGGAPAGSDAEAGAGTADSGGGGLHHVYPHLEKKPSL